MKIDNNTSLSFDLGTGGLITFIVFICLKCSGVWDIPWFGVWFPLWLPIALIAVAFVVAVILGKIINK